MAGVVAVLGVVIPELAWLLWFRDHFAGSVGKYDRENDGAFIGRGVFG
jgi:hypothetical protein